MPAERFFIEAPLENSLELEGDELHHLRNVMRAKPGEIIELVNGKGSFAKAKILSFSKHSAKLDVIEHFQQEPKEKTITLAIPIMRPSKLELVIEKCTELGADHFCLYPAEFSEKKELSDHQLTRLKNIAISSMKQCGRLFLPTIEKQTFQEIFQKSLSIFFGDPEAENPLPHSMQSVIVITGPEKGFSKQEMKNLKSSATAVKLSENILRAETAPIVATVLLI